MAFTNQSTTTLFDLVTKLDTFMVANGWTSDQIDNSAGVGKWAIHKGSVYISGRWNTTSPNNIALFQALGFINAATNPGNHTDDSGNGVITTVDATMGQARFIPVTNSPVQFWAFTDAGNTYCHVVVQRDATTFAHFGFGNIQKIGDWTGGEYCYGFRPEQAFSTTVAIRRGTSALLDGLAASIGAPVPSNMQDFAATMHAVGLPAQGGTGKWAVVMGGEHSSASLGTDRAGVARIHFLGGFRGGPIAAPFGRFPGDSIQGLIPMYPIMTAHFERTSGDIRILGFMGDVRGMSNQFFANGDSFLIGSDTWYVFPTFLKWAGSGAHTGTSDYQGIAYKKIP